jgi:heme oxygenase
MADIKSAAEIAREKVEKLEGPTDEERLRWKYVPEGEKLAANYLKQNINLVAELGNYDKKVLAYVKEGASEILVRNINLPRNDLAKKTNKKAMEGLKTIKKDKVAVENIFSSIRNIFKHYADQGEQQRKQAYASLKADFEVRVRQAMQQQLSPLMGMKIDVEREPQFQEEWRRLQIQLDGQYLKLLDEYKQELLSIA